MDFFYSYSFFRGPAIRRLVIRELLKSDAATFLLTRAIARSKAADRKAQTPAQRAHTLGRQRPSRARNSSRKERLSAPRRFVLWRRDEARTENANLCIRGQTPHIRVIFRLFAEMGPCDPTKNKVFVIESLRAILSEPG